MTARPCRSAGEDLARWARLVGEARRCAANPALATRELEQACGRAMRAKVPAGELTRANPFIVLLDVARLYAGETMAGRAAMQDRLKTALAAADELRPLPGAGAPEPGGEASPRYRADIDG